MRLATLAFADSSKGNPDGELVVVSPDGMRFLTLDGNTSLLRAIENWVEVRPRLEAISARLSAGNEGTPLSERTVLAPLPRTYSMLDGSAFIQHILLVRKARNAEPPEDLFTVPLMYQGAGDHLYSAVDDFPLPDEQWGLDCEAEVAVILHEVPMGTTAAEAPKYIALFLLMNDWSYRNLIPRELKAGFGFFHGKPASAFSPFAVTPDELKESFRDGRVQLPLSSKRNGARMGSPNCGEMHFSFFDLIAHAAKTRVLPAGTILGSGTVSNADRSAGVSCIAELRTIEQLDSGSPKTPYLSAGEQIEIEMEFEGRSLFGKLSAKVVPSRDHGGT